MGATFARLKDFTEEVLTSADLDAEFDNILNNLKPSGVDDYSVSVAEMQTQTDPGESGSESLATSLAGELERIRFALKELKGKTYWYQTPASTIDELTNALGGGLPTHRIVSGAESTQSSMPAFLDPANTTNSVVLLGATTNFVYTVEDIQYTITTNVTASGLTSAPTTNNTAAVNNTAYADQLVTKHAGEYDTSLAYDTAGSEITGLDTKIAAFKVNNGTTNEYFLAYVDNTNSKLIKARRGYFFDTSQAEIPRIVITDNDSITLMKLTWIFAKTDKTLEVSYTNPIVSTDEPGSPAIGDYWFDLAADKWKVRASAAWNNASASLIGICIQNESGNTVGARGIDFFADHNELNTFELEYVGATQIRAKNSENTIKVYGTTVRIHNYKPVWDITTDLETGVTESASTIYYAYLKESCDRVLSDIAPYSRLGDLNGYYHPYETWRYVGCIENNSSTAFDTATVRNAPEMQAPVAIVYTSSATWTLRPGVRRILALAIAGGGGGGGANSVTAASSGGGGGGGGSALKLIDSSFNVSETISIGAAGTAGSTAGGNGGTGGSSSFGTHCIAAGGVGGTGDTQDNAGNTQGASPGAGGTSSAGDLQLKGSGGIFGFVLGTTSGISGGGGSSILGGSAVPIGSDGTGQDGGKYGGGGSGGIATGAPTDYAGGSGGPGVVYAIEIYSKRGV